MRIKAENASSAFKQAFDLVKTMGEPNENTLRLTGVMFEIIDPLNYSQGWPLWRKWSRSYVDIEWKWYEAATRNPEMVEKVASIWTKMKDKWGEVNSNYGWQANRKDQWKHCAYAIAESMLTGKGTRKHVISIYDGKERDLYNYDTPCTISFTFILKRVEGKKFKLDIHTHMRSNDVWYGLCNDLPAFALFQIKMMGDVQTEITERHNNQASDFRLSIGRHVHFVDDLHLYNDFIDKKNENI